MNNPTTITHILRALSIASPVCAYPTPHITTDLDTGRIIITWALGGITCEDDVYTAWSVDQEEIDLYVGEAAIAVEALIHFTMERRLRTFLVSIFGGGNG